MHCGHESPPTCNHVFLEGSEDEVHNAPQSVEVCRTREGASGAPEGNVGRARWWGVGLMVADQVHSNGRVPAQWLQLLRALPPADGLHKCQVRRILHAPGLTWVVKD